MSESYTTGGDNWQPLAGFDISGQTFTPLESHACNFIDLNLWLFGYTPPWIYLTKCDSSHTPIGPILANAHVTEPLVYLPPAKRRVRYQLDTPISLTAGTIYSIHIRQALNHRGPNNLVLYDKDDATYPRGHIIFSDDGGNTWTHFPNSDFIFVEFGNPPLPQPLPVPPIAHFAPLALQYIPTPLGITLRLSTSVPCHLDCYYTDVKPLVHPRERVIRGARLPDGSYHCFVAWKLIEQTEPGDTLYHTFIMPPWAICQTKWFTFRGTVDEIISPSIGPIFKKHHQRTSDIFTLRPNAPGERCTISREAGFDCPNHYANVADIVPDENVTTVYDSPRPGYTLDFYNIQDPPPLNALINLIAVVARFKANTLPTLKSAHICINVGGQFYTRTGQFDPFIANPWNSDAFQVTTTWANYQSIWLQNPVTSNPWTLQDIKDLQIGVAVRNPRHIAPTIGKYTYCTQLYIDVKYQTIV